MLLEGLVQLTLCTAAAGNMECCFPKPDSPANLNMLLKPSAYTNPGPPGLITPHQLARFKTKTLP